MGSTRQGSLAVTKARSLAETFPRAGEELGVADRDAAAPEDMGRVKDVASRVAFDEDIRQNSASRVECLAVVREGGLANGATERWLSGRKRRFAKSVNRETGSAGSNPVRSASRECSSVGRAFDF